MNSSTPKSIVIVGGGASATLLLAQLSIQLKIHNTSQPIDIYVVDNSDAHNVGIAYQVQHSSFLLNVAANAMGAYYDKPDDFYQWLTTYPELWRKLHDDFRSIEFQPNDFVPRMIYGVYLRWVFDHAKNLAQTKNINIHSVNALVTQVNLVNNTLYVTTDGHDPIIANTLVFATGNIAQKHQDLRSPHIFSSPYCQEFLQEDWSSTKNIIIVGSGLSMVDAVQYLEQQNYSGNIQVFSRHGLIPLPHSTQHNSQEAPSLSLKDLNTARKIVCRLRGQIDINSRQGISWQKTIQEFRIHANSIWLSLPAIEQKKLKRFLPWWNIARHRIPADIHEKILRLKNEGRLSIIKGDVRKVDTDGEYFLLTLNHKTILITSEKLVICSGYNVSYDNLMHICGNLVPPVVQLKKDFNYNQLRISTEYSIYALGPTLKDILFETTAIHEIRQQSKVIASEIAHKQQHPFVHKKKYLSV